MSDDREWLIDEVDRLEALVTEMLAALERIAAIVSDYEKGQRLGSNDTQEVLEAARTAIAKAEPKP